MYDVFYFNNNSILHVSEVVSATSDYTQDIPPLQRPWERMTGPPILPPHLLQIILNKDTPLSVSCCSFGHILNYLIIYHPFRYNSISVRTNFITRTKSRNVESPVRFVYQRRRHGAQCNTSLP